MKIVIIKFHSKINEKCCKKKFKLSSQVLIIPRPFCLVVMSQVFLLQKLEIITTKASKEDFYLGHYDNTHIDFTYKDFTYYKKTVVVQNKLN